MRKVGIHDLTIRSGNCIFSKKTLTGKWDEKRRNPRSTIQSSVLQVFDRKAVKGKGDEKSIEKWESKIEHPKFFLPSAVPGQLRKTIDRISTRITRTTYEKTELFKGCLELSMYLWCALSLPPHLPIQSSFLELFEKKL